MASFDHWMRLNIGDYLADTVHLNATQHGAYLLLLFATFKRGFLLEDDRILARIARMSTRAWKREKEPILALFQCEDGRLTHKRINAERAEAERLASRARASRDRARNRDSLAGGRGTTATATTTKQGEGVRTPSTPKEEPSKPPAAREASVVSIHARKGNGADGN